MEFLKIGYALLSLMFFSWVNSGSPSSNDLAVYQELKKHIVEEEDSLLLDIKFWNCGIDCDEDNIMILQGLKKYLIDNPFNTYQIECYTDCRGGDKENVTLSLERAEMIRKWLTGEGILMERVVAKGFGMRKPLVDCVCSDCTPLEHVANRRVAIRLVNIYSSEGLADRVVLEKPWLRQQTHYKGKVVIRTCIDKSGLVTGTELYNEETTATDKDFINAALQIAKEWRFTDSEKDMQCGTITYDYGIDE